MLFGSCPGSLVCARVNGVRVGFVHDSGRWDAALFGRNITDEENLKGVIDFNNNTGFVNDRSIWGATFSYYFGER